MNWKNEHVLSIDAEILTTFDSCQFQKLNLEKIKAKYLNAKEIVDTAMSLSDKQRQSLKKAKMEYELAERLSIVKSNTRISPVRSSTPFIKKAKISKKQRNKRLDTSRNDLISLQEKSDSATNTIHEQEEKLKQMKEKLDNLQEEKLNVEMESLHLQDVIRNLKQKEFKVGNVMKKPKTFHYLCGLSIKQFTVLLECVQPYTHFIHYPNCLDNVYTYLIDIGTELFMICTWK